MASDFRALNTLNHYCCFKDLSLCHESNQVYHVSNLLSYKLNFIYKKTWLVIVNI